LQRAEARSTLVIFLPRSSYNRMIKLTAPSTPAFLISLLLGGAGIAGKLGYFAIAAPNAFWLLTVAFVLLLLSTIFRGL
jgi:hypothetical protein